MCGRYIRKSDKQRIAEAFHIRNDISTLAMPPDDYNIAPSTFQPVIRESKDEAGRELVMMRWGLIPFFTKQLSDLKGMSTINARAETILSSPTWREPFQKRRCLVPVSGFYEWHKIDAKTRKPYVFTVADSSLFAFAGLWDAWKDPGGGWLQSFSIVTTEANELMSSIHTRMPVILHNRDYDRWLARDVTEQPPIDLLRPFESDEMEMEPANQAVGNVRNNGPEMLIGEPLVNTVSRP
ncbi:putative SOS response-associated peptidase YedK [Granulicella aggregans]|uniref:Abasic site processing protein n=3 Tax=Granulicella aggregans TaxID=474949 RepID=A0A7W7ZBX8_9BACT|nr:putative SOS response-associated peptidase YedK [Granulicella aggregans]